MRCSVMCGYNKVKTEAFACLDQLDATQARAAQGNLINTCADCKVHDVSPTMAVLCRA